MIDTTDRLTSVQLTNDLLLSYHNTITDYARTYWAILLSRKNNSDCYNIILYESFEQIWSIFFSDIIFYTFAYTQIQNRLFKSKFVVMCLRCIRVN